MGTGRIVDFNQPNQGTNEPKRLQQHTYRGGVEVQGGGGIPQPVEVRLHEEVIEEGQDKIRRKKDGSPDLRFRNAPSSAEWEKIKRGDWEDK